MGDNISSGEPVCFERLGDPMCSEVLTSSHLKLGLCMKL